VPDESGAAARRKMRSHRRTGAFFFARSSSRRVATQEVCPRARGGTAGRENVVGRGLCLLRPAPRDGRRTSSARKLDIGLLANVPFGREARPHAGGADVPLLVAQRSSSTTVRPWSVVEMSLGSWVPRMTKEGSDERDPCRRIHCDGRAAAPRVGMRRARRSSTAPSPRRCNDGIERTLRV